MKYTLTAIDAYFMYTVLLKMYFMYVKWVVSKNTQTPKFQIFPGRLGSSKRKNLGVGPKNRKGGALSIPNVENLFENLFEI